MYIRALLGIDVQLPAPYFFLYLELMRSGYKVGIYVVYKLIDIYYAKPANSGIKYVIITLFRIPFKHKAKYLY